MQDEILWDRWISYLAVALDLDEQNDYRSFIFAGGKPKDFRWSSSDHAGTRSSGDVAGEMIRQFGSNAKKGDIWEWGEATGKQTVTLADKWEEQPNGKYVVVGQVWIDENGKEVDTTGYSVVVSNSGEAVAYAKSIAERLG